MSARTLRGKVAVAGIGETTYYKHGKSPDPEFALALKAILRACEDAGISPREVDGFASYSNDRNDPSRIAAPESRGIVVVRAPRKGDAFEGRIAAELARASCGSNG